MVKFNQINCSFHLNDHQPNIKTKNLPNNSVIIYLKAIDMYYSEHENLEKHHFFHFFSFEFFSIKFWSGPNFASTYFNKVKQRKVIYKVLFRVRTGP